MKQGRSPGRARPRIHITAVASTATQNVERLGGMAKMLQLARDGAGPAYEVTASERMICCKQDDLKGGRPDDEARAREVQTLLADDGVRALVTIRGGAWFTRILDRIDFDVLKRRKSTIYIFGFSEMSTLTAIAGRYPKAVALYDLGPGFLYAGMEDAILAHPEQYAMGVSLPREQLPGFATGFALARFPDEFRGFFADVGAILDGRGSDRVPAGRLLLGRLPEGQPITITGGCLSVIASILGTRYADAIDTTGKWLALEDVNEAPDPLDRMMAALRLNGLFDRAEGVILGRFIDHRVDLTDAAFEIVRRHLPKRRSIPVIALDNLGHVYPIAPLPMQREVVLRRTGSGRTPRVRIEIPWSAWARR